jgi:predicted nucleic acid-binding protein
MAETQYLVDSNILLRWVKPDHNDYSLIVSAIDLVLQRQGRLCYTSQNLGEFWSTCTRPVDRIGFALSPQETDRRAKLFEGRLRFLPDSLAVHEEWRRLLVTYGVSGVQVHDARLAAAMRVHGVVRILTFNDRDFARYDQIEAIHPRAVSARLSSGRD